MNFVKINPKDIDLKTRYHLLISSISPRPIALVGTKDKNNNINLAPFSFFNGFGANPPIIGFSPALSGKTGLPKDTLLNINETKEFTVSIVTEDIVNQVSLSSCEYDSNVDEFIKAGFTKKKSLKVKPPGVEESPIIMECKLREIINLGGQPGSGNLILGEVVMFHVKDNKIDANKYIDPRNINHVGRSGGGWYTSSLKSFFELNKPKGIGIGFDNLPKTILESDLSGKYLSMLASVDSIPKLKNINMYVSHSIEDVLKLVKKLLDENKINDAWQVILNWMK